MMKSVPKQDKRFHPKIHRHGADQSTEKNSGHADKMRKNQRGSQIYGGLKNSLVPVVPEKSERIFKH